MLKAILAGGLVAGLLGTGVVDPPPNDSIFIDVVTVQGSGCTNASAVAVSTDGTSITIAYSNFVARVGVGALPTDIRKNCQLSLVIHVPAGETFALGPVQHSGFASLAPGANALLRTRTYFAGQTTSPYWIHTFSGPWNDNVVVAESFDPATAIFYPCGFLRNTNVNLELRVNAGTSDPRKTTSFIALNESLTMQLIRRSCPTH